MLFTGKVLEETGLVYFGARWYDPEIGRFISVDPAEDGENWYGYCGGDPVNWVDPDGLRIWFIHGTASNSRTWVLHFSEVRQRITEYFGDTADFRFNWGPNNNDDTVRRAAAELLANQIRAYHQNHPTEKIRIVAHSHGGNVAIMAANILGNPLKGTPIMIDNLITVSTPVREYQRLYNNVRVHNQVFNVKDQVQINGGTGSKTPYPKNAFGNPGETGTAGRRFINANNIEVDVSKAKIKGINMLESHGIVLRNLTLWTKQVEPQLWR
jgi:RHS repeat-associated protein